MHRDLVEEYEEWLRLEQFAAMQAKMKPAPEPEPVDPFMATTQGPQGNVVPDWKAFGRNYTPEQLEIHSTVEDIRFNDDPAEFYFKMCNEEKREVGISLAGDWFPGNRARRTTTLRVTDYRKGKEGITTEITESKPPFMGMGSQDSDGQMRLA